MKNASMQRLAAVLSISIMFAGCSQQEPNTPAADASPATAASDMPATAAPVAGGAVEEYVPSAAISPGGHCFLDAINGGSTAGGKAQVGKDVSFGGWVSDIDNQVPKTALFVLEGASKSYSIPLVAGGERPDVAAALSNEALKNSGYDVIGRLDAVVPGEYSLAIILGADRTSRCDLNAKLAIAN